MQKLLHLEKEKKINKVAQMSHLDMFPIFVLDVLVRVVGLGL